MPPIIDLESNMSEDHGIVASPAKATRSKICDRQFVTPSGVVKHAAPDVTELNMVFTSGDTLRVALGDLPESIVSAAAWHGISQKIGDAFASAKGDAGAAFESASALLEVLASGDWVQKGESAGPAPTMILEAIIRGIEATGEVVDDARRVGIVEKLKDKATRKGALENPAIAAHYETIRAERAQAKAADAAEKVTELDTIDF